jgi:hypothetical protein
MDVHPAFTLQLISAAPGFSLRVKPVLEMKRLRSGRLATTNIEQRHVRSLERLAVVGGDMLFKISLVLLSLWLIGVVGVYRVGDLVHVLLLAGLMLLLLAFLRARDAAARAPQGGPANRS